MFSRRDYVKASLTAVVVSMLHVSTPALKYAFADERGTRAEAKAMADDALNHIKSVGFESALKDFTSNKAHWNKKDLYPVVFAFDGRCLAHGVNEKLVGKNMLEIKDQEGRPFVQLFINSAKEKNESWVDFSWAHPQTKKPEPKTMNTRRIPGQDAVLVVGFYR